MGSGSKSHKILPAGGGKCVKTGLCTQRGLCINGGLCLMRGMVSRGAEYQCVTDARSRSVMQGGGGGGGGKQWMLLLGAGQEEASTWGVQRLWAPAARVLTDPQRILQCGPAVQTKLDFVGAAHAHPDQSQVETGRQLLGLGTDERTADAGSCVRGSGQSNDRPVWNSGRVCRVCLVLLCAGPCGCLRPRIALQFWTLRPLGLGLLTLRSSSTEGARGLAATSWCWL